MRVSTHKAAVDGDVPCKAAVIKRPSNQSRTSAADGSTITASISHHDAIIDGDGISIATISTANAS